MKKSLYFAAVTAGAMLAGTGVAAGQEPSTHTVTAGESLSRISRAELGTTDRWGEIFALNRDTVARPELIEVGQVLVLPGTATAVPAAVPAAPPHTVTAGETLSKISLSELGTWERWVEIFAVNRSTIASPDVLHVGQVLEIPAAPVDVPADLLASVTASAPVRSASRQSATIGTQGVASSGGAGGNLASIRACESSGNYAAVSPDGLYRGAYQFDRPTWQSVGGSGDPAAASPAEQDARASQLWSQRGSNPWPNCG